jgi:cation transport regulator ChaB
MIQLSAFPRSSSQQLNISSRSSSALEQTNDHDDDGDHDQEMDETAADVTEEAEKPEHEQDNNDSPKHGVPFD